MKSHDSDEEAEAHLKEVRDLPDEVGKSVCRYKAT